MRKISEVKVKWVGYPNSTWEPFSVLNNKLKKLLVDKKEKGAPCTLTANEIWDDFFDDPDSSIFDTQTARAA